MTSRERFLAACRCQPVDRPPIWIMRQAGRYLPEYRQLRSRYGFLELVKTPELATAVTLQPLNRFRLDAGILFCDILVIPEALGQPYHFKDDGGIEMDFRIESPDQIDGLDANGVGERLDYAIQAIRMVRSEVGDRQAVLGFGGSPLTLAAYMVEGGGSPTFARLKQLFWRDRPNYNRLLEKITRALIEFFLLQIGSGVDAVQIFDSWAAICPAHAYDEMSLSWIREIIDALPRSTPVILYAKGMAAHSRMLASTGASVLGIDWTVQLSRVHAGLEEPVALQGNLDPLVMTTEPEIVESEARRILEDMAPFPGHIFNLGHGITPDARIENVHALIETVEGFACR